MDVIHKRNKQTVNKSQTRYEPGKQEHTGSKHRNKCQEDRTEKHRRQRYKTGEAMKCEGKTWAQIYGYCRLSHEKWVYIEKGWGNQTRRGSGKWNMTHEFTVYFQHKTGNYKTKKSKPYTPITDYCELWHIQSGFSKLTNRLICANLFIVPNFLPLIGCLASHQTAYPDPDRNLTVRY